MRRWSREGRGSNWSDIFSNTLLQIAVGIVVVVAALVINSNSITIATVLRGLVGEARKGVMEEQKEY